MSHLVLWRLTSQSFCKDTYKVYNLQLFAINLTLFYDIFFIYRPYLVVLCSLPKYQ